MSGLQENGGKAFEIVKNHLHPMEYLGAQTCSNQFFIVKNPLVEVHQPTTSPLHLCLTQFRVIKTGINDTSILGLILV